MKQIYEDYITLVRCALEGKNADEFSGDFTALLKLAREHNMTNILWYALRNNRNVPTAVTAELQGSHNMLLFKCANQKLARAEIERIFYEQGIEHIFLKGADVAELYPSEDMREMADIDVYADVEEHERVKAALLNIGYSFEGHKGHHDVFHRDPFLSVEVHESVLDHQRDTRLEQYFVPPWKLAHGDTVSRYFDLSDNYIFLMGHLFGHFHQGGIGVRVFADMALYIKKYADELEWDRINSVFDSCGVLEVMNNLKSLALHWFGDEPENELIDEMGEYVFESGSYGRTANVAMYLADEDSGSGNPFWSTVRGMLLLPADEMRRRSKAVDRCPLLLPFAYVVRTVKIFFTQFRRVLSWMRDIKNTDVEDVKKYKNMMHRFGVK